MLKLPVRTVGRITLNPTLKKVKVVNIIDNQYVACDDSGYYLQFSGLPTVRFFVHQAYDKKTKASGFSVTEESTGLRVAWAKTNNEAIDRAVFRINDYLRRKGLGSFLRMIANQPKIETLSQGHDGTVTAYTAKPKPGQPDCGEDVQSLSETRATHALGKSVARPVKRAFQKVRISEHDAGGKKVSTDSSRRVRIGNRSR